MEVVIDYIMWVLFVCVIFIVKFVMIMLVFVFVWCWVVIVDKII